MRKLILIIGAIMTLGYSQYNSADEILNDVYNKELGYLKLRITDGTNSSTINSDGQFHVVLTGKIDTSNSTSTPLLADAVFTGDSTNILDYGFIFVTVFSDVASATDGLSVQQSSNGTNWDNTDEFTVPAGTGKTFSFQPGAKYLRVVYTNGGSGQSAFRLQTVLKKTGSLASSHRIQDAISTDDDAELVKAVITGENPGGAFINFEATTAGNFKVSLEEYNGAFTTDPFPVRDPNLHLAQGLITGMTHVNKFGRAPSGVQTTNTDIWDRANATPTQQEWTAPTQARAHNIVSSSNSDSTGNGGALTIRIYGLPRWTSTEISEVIIMDGVNNVVTDSSYVIIYRMEVLTKGSTSVNVGIITATAITDGTVTAQINASQGQTQMAIYGIPSTQTAYMTQYYLSLHEAGAVPSTTLAVDIELLINPEPDVELTNFLIKHTQGVNNISTSYLNHNYKPYFRIPGPAIIKVHAISTAVDTDASGGFDLIIIEN